MNKNNIFSRLWAWIIGEVKQIPTIEQHIVQFADKVTDELKIIASSDVAKFIESGILAIAQAIDPSLVPLIAGIENYIPKLIGLVTGIKLIIDQEGAKPIVEQLQDGINALQSGKSEDTIVYAGNLGTISAALSNYVISNNAMELGIDVPEPAQLLSAGQAIHAHGFDDVQIAAAALPDPSEEKAAESTDPNMDIVNETKANLTSGNPADMGASFKDKIAANNAKATEAGKAVDPTNYEVTGDNTGPDTVV